LSTEVTQIHPLLAHLNPVQAEAIQHTDGPLLIFAGAGSGKTRVLTHRVAWLIAEMHVQPRHILAVTFTNKAAQEMRERIVRLVEEEGRQIWVGTFHATCARILRESGDKIGLERDFLVYDDHDEMVLVRECLTQLHIDDKKFAPRAVLSHISRAKAQIALRIADAIEARRIGARLEFVLKHTDKRAERRVPCFARDCYRTRPRTRPRAIDRRRGRVRGRVRFLSGHIPVKHLDVVHLTLMVNGVPIEQVDREVGPSGGFAVVNRIGRGIA
jgi:hypothetical protein